MDSLRSLQELTATCAAEALGCTVQHLRFLIRQGRIEAVKHGRDWVIESDSLKAFKAERDEAARNEAGVANEQMRLFGDAEFEGIVNVASVPQRSPFRYPGGKTWLVPVVRHWLKSQHRSPTRLVEPFAGGGITGLTAAFEGIVQESTLVELDPEVAAVWKVMLSKRCEQLCERILRFLCSEQHVRSALSTPPRSELDRAFLAILRNRVSRGGILAPGAGLVKNGEAGKGIASRWYPETLVKRMRDIYQQRAKIRFIEADGLEFLEGRRSDQDCAFFIDPPYPVAGRRLYTHFSVDHRRLFEIISALAGPFLATYDHNAEIASLAAEFGFQTQLIPMKNTHHAKKFELLISRDLSWLAAADSEPLPAAS